MGPGTTEYFGTELTNLGQIKVKATSTGVLDRTIF